MHKLEKGQHELQIVVSDEVYQRLLTYKQNWTWVQLLEAFMDSVNPEDRVDPEQQEVSQ